MRRRGSAKQCFWLGPSRYLCSRRRRYTNADTDCDTYGKSHRNRNRDSISISYTYTTSYAHTQSWANGKAASHSNPPSVRADR